MKVNLLLLLLTLSASFIPIYSQDKPKRDKAVSIELNLTVVDATGNPVDNVRPENVKIFEDGIEQKLDALEKKDAGLTLGIAVDNSGSTRVLFERLVQAANIIVKDLAAADEIFVVRFISSDKIEIVEDFTRDKQKLVYAFKEKMYIEGGQSAVIDAVYLSMGMLMERERSSGNTRHGLILISDCEDRDSYYSPTDLFDFVSKSNAQIFPLAFTGALSNGRNTATGLKDSKQNAERLAHHLAVNTGGTAYILGQRAVEADLLARLKDIMTELRSPYVVRYVSTNPNRDDNVRKLRVEITDGPGGEKRIGKVRESFVLPKDVPVKARPQQRRSS